MDCDKMGSNLTPVLLYLHGRLAEWTKAAVLKTDAGNTARGSNPLPSAIMRHDEAREDVNYKLFVCDNCHELWLAPEHFNVNWDAWHGCGTVRDLCVIHRLRKGSLGFFDKCGGCLYRFLCASSVPKVWS